jgi:NADH-quinone oxidoreductase subunit C
MNALLTEVASRFPWIQRLDGRIWEEPALVVTPDKALELASFLKQNDICSFNYLRSVTGVDKTDRFKVVYNLARIPVSGADTAGRFERIGMVVRVDDYGNPHVPSMTSLWRGADFQEREIFDLLGIAFDGHPDLRRILLDEAFKGHPLRKDYPLIGRWDDMVAMDAHLDEQQIKEMKEEAGLEFDPKDVPPNYKR